MKDYDESSYCPKCEWHEVSSHWYAADERRWLSASHGVEAEKEEHIRRTCLRCHYSWNEMPLDERKRLDFLKD